LSKYLLQRNKQNSCGRIMQKIRMTSVLLAVFLLLEMTEVAQSIRCYQCTSENSVNCGANPVTAGLPTCIGDTCSKGSTTQSGRTVIVRSCLNSSVATSCQDVSTDGLTVRVCFCNTELCNSENRLLQNHVFILMSVLIAVVFSFTGFAK